MFWKQKIRMPSFGPAQARNPQFWKFFSGKNFNNKVINEFHLLTQDLYHQAAGALLFWDYLNNNCQFGIKKLFWGYFGQAQARLLVTGVNDNFPTNTEFAYCQNKDMVKRWSVYLERFSRNSPGSEKS